MSVKWGSHTSAKEFLDSLVEGCLKLPAFPAVVLQQAVNRIYASPGQDVTALPFRGRRLVG